MPDLLFGLLVGCVLGVVAHEAGHVVMALMTGFRLRAITIGWGSTVFSSKYRGVRVKLNSIPLSGRVAVFPELYQRKIPLLLFAAGGVVANILLGLGVVLLSELGYVPKDIHQAVAGFYYVQAFLIIWNLIPQTRTVNGEAALNDGKTILSILESTNGSIGPFAQMYLLLLAPYTNGNVSLSALSPASQRLIDYFYMGLSESMDRDERDDLFRKYIAELGQGELSREEELYILDKLITDAVVTGDPAAKVHIDEWSSRAMSLGPDIKTLKFSRAAALIELGRFAEGKALAEANAAPDDKPFDSLLNSTFLARAEAGLGNLERADQLLSAAKDLFKTMAAEKPRHEIYRLLEETGKRIQSGTR